MAPRSVHIFALAVLTVSAAAAPAAFARQAPDNTEPAAVNGVRGLNETAWLATDADIAFFLTRAPAECWAAPTSEREKYLLEAGRAAFRSPLLLGGQAARSGLSCNACHRNGGANPAFYIEGVSGAPGTADVTHSLFSKSREDRTFNPVLIPVLNGMGEKASFGTVTPVDSLEGFISGAIEDEFQGRAPTEAILQGLVDYVQMISAAPCKGGDAPVTLMLAATDFRRALEAAQTALDHKDSETADFLILSAQRIAGDIHARFASPQLMENRRRLEEIARELAAVRRDIVRSSGPAAGQLAKTMARFDDLTRSLLENEALSLYNAEIVAKSIASKVGRND